MNLETINTLLPMLAIVPLIANVLLMIKVIELKRRVINSHVKTHELLAFVRQQQSRKALIKAKQAIVEKTVNSSTVAVENIHQSLSDAAFNVINNLSSTDKTKTRNQKLRDLHDQTSSDVYKSVKVVNKQVGIITEAFLSTRKPSRSNEQSPSVQHPDEKLTGSDKKSKQRPPKR